MVIPECFPSKTGNFGTFLSQKLPEKNKMLDAMELLV
jgi:hypothetical protein